MRRNIGFGSDRLETLEDRVVPAGNLTVTNIGGVIRVVGDPRGNVAEITPGLNGGVVVRGLDGTTVNGKAQTFVLPAGTPLTGLDIDLKAGHDEVVVSNRSETDPRWPVPPALPRWAVGGNLSVHAGAGRDTVLLRNLIVAGAVDVRGESGDDIVVAEQVVAGTLAVDTSSGEDRVLLRNVSVFGAAGVRAGSGSDAVGVITSAFSSATTLDLGSGADDASVEGNTFIGAVALLGGGSKNRLTEDAEGRNIFEAGFTHAGWSETLEPVAAVHFTYEGEEGPEHWGELTPAWLLTEAGRQQTPVAIVTAATVPVALPALNFSYQDGTDLPFVHNGHTIQVNFPNPAANTLTVNGNVYRLLQFHFHAPSEHTVNGASFPLELHLVHRDAGGNLLVVTVLIAQGSENAAYAPLVANLPDDHGQPHTTIPGPFDPETLLPAVRSIYAYGGSLTTPPGSEGVSFALFTTPVQLSAAQIQAFETAIGEHNNRPLQPLHHRTVFRSV